MTQLTPYATAGAKLVDKNYSAIPIMPGTKRPGAMSFKKWFGRSDWQQYCDRLPTQYEVPLWERWPDAGVCIAIDHQLKVIDIDTDDLTLIEAVRSVLPDSDVKKRGAKGFSAFYRGSRAIVSTPFSIPTAGKPLRVVDLLAHGRQTVLPPTIHPNGQPYEWLTRDTLIDTPLQLLPELPDNVADELARVLEPFGYVPTAEHYALVRGDGDRLWREINDLALLRLDAWVPALQLPGTHRSGKGWRAVADWRGVDAANLSFHPDGIKDWGADEPHTPIDVVMLAMGTDCYTATQFLVPLIGYQFPENDDFDVAGFVARNLARTSPPSAQNAPLVAPLVAPATLAPETENIPPVAAPRANVNPFDLDTHGGLLGDISAWILATARAPVPEFATIAALAFLSAFYGRRYVTPTGAGLNMYLIGIAGPGFGKDHPRRAIEAIGYDAQFQKLIGPNEVTSDSAIEKILRLRPVFVMPWDEVGVILQSVSGRQAQSWTRSIRKALLELYSRSNGQWTGKEHADLKRDSCGEPVHCPTVSLLGMSTPTEFYKGMTEDNLSDGMFARMTVITATNRPEHQDTPPLLMVPPALVAKLRAAYDAKPASGNLGKTSKSDPLTKPDLLATVWDVGACERWKQIEAWQYTLIDERPEYDGIVSRAAEQTVKLATIRALSRNPVDPLVSVGDVEWGYGLVQCSLDAIDDGVTNYMAGSEFEALHKRLLAVVTAAGKDGISKSVLMRKRGLSKVKEAELDAAAKWLQTAGLLQTKIAFAKNVGRPSVRYCKT